KNETLVAVRGVSLCGISFCRPSRPRHPASGCARYSGHSGKRPPPRSAPLRPRAGGRGNANELYGRLSQVRDGSAKGAGPIAGGPAESIFVTISKVAYAGGVRQPLRRERERRVESGHVAQFFGIQDRAPIACEQLGRLQRLRGSSLRGVAHGRASISSERRNAFRQRKRAGRSLGARRCGGRFSWPERLPPQI